MSLAHYMELFQGRTDAFAEQQDDGSYRPVRRPITKEDYLAHGRGEHTYGIYTTQRNNTTKLLVFDVDVLDNFETLTKIATVLDVFAGVWFWTEFSGRKGHHIWVFFERWNNAKLVRRAGLGILQVAGVKCEVFPKQNEVSDLGNLVKLPLGIHRVSGEWSVGIERDWRDAELVTYSQLENMAARYQEPTPPSINRVPIPAQKMGDASKTLERRLDLIAETPEGERNNTLYKTAVWLFNWVHSGALDRDAVVLGLTGAGQQAGLRNDEIGRTINSAWDFSLRRPLPLQIGD